jgi:hypothetical protein
MGRQAPSGDRKFMRQIEKHMKARRSLAETGYVPDEARPVRDASELSPQLESLTSSIRAPDAWRAWLEGPRSWFLDGRLTGSPGAFPEQPTLMLTFRDHDARVAAAGVWRRTAAGRWELQPGLASSLMSGTVH